jgi:hypothetical protein
VRFSRRERRCSQYEQHIAHQSGRSLPTQQSLSSSKSNVASNHISISTRNSSLQSRLISGVLDSFRHRRVSGHPTLSMDNGNISLVVRSWPWTTCGPQVNYSCKKSISIFISIVIITANYTSRRITAIEASSCEPSRE